MGEKRAHGVNITRVVPVAIAREVEEDFSCRDEIMSGSIKPKNLNVLFNLQEKLSHLPAPEQKQMISLITEFTVLFPDVLGRTDCMCHDIDVMGVTPIKQHP